MTKYYCDLCGDEITKNNPNVVTNRLTFRLKGHVFQLIVGTDSVWNQGALDEKCVRKLLAKAKPEAIFS